MKTKDLHIIARYTKKPNNRSLTHQKGYMSDPANYYFDEVITVAKGVRPAELQTAGIVLNLNKKTVILNNYAPEMPNFDSLFKYFLEAQPKHIAGIMAELDLDYLKQFLPALPAEDESAELVPPL